MKLCILAQVLSRDGREEFDRVAESNDWKRIVVSCI